MQFSTCDRQKEIGLVQRGETDFSMQFSSSTCLFETELGKSTDKTPPRGTEIVIKFVSLIIKIMFKLVTIVFTSLFAISNADIVKLDTPALVQTDPASIQRHLLEFENVVVKGMPTRYLQEGECTCEEDDSLYTGECKGPTKRNDENWCDFGVGSVCCASSSSGCCKVTPGASALFSVLGLAIIGSIVLCSCACCECCPLHSKLCCAKKRKNAHIEEKEAAPAPTPVDEEIDA